MLGFAASGSIANPLSLDPVIGRNRNFNDGENSLAGGGDVSDRAAGERETNGVDGAQTAARGFDYGANVGVELGSPFGAEAVGDVVDGAPTASNVPRWMLSQTI